MTNYVANVKKYSDIDTLVNYRGINMTRVDIYNRMKELGIKHYINSAWVLIDGKIGWSTRNLNRCHYKDETFEEEIKRLENQGYNFFDVIHLH